MDPDIVERYPSQRLRPGLEAVWQTSSVFRLCRADIGAGFDLGKAMAEALMRGRMDRRRRAGFFAGCGLGNVGRGRFTSGVRGGAAHKAICFLA